MAVMPPASARSGAKLDVEILLCCARSRLDEGDIGRLRSLAAGPVPWEDLCTLAIQHGLGPLVYLHLRGAAADLALAPVMTRLRAHFQMHARENLRIVEELARLLREFERLGLRVIPWKGCALGLAIYGNLALRKSGDLDLLIPPREFKKATEVMLSLGYRITTPRRRNGRADDWDCYEFRFVRPDGRVTVEIPWRVPPRSRYFQAGLSFEELWDRRERIAGSGHRIPGLPAEEMLLCLCVHGARHQWDRLMWVCDIAELLRSRPDLDWDRVQRRARTLGYGRLLTLGLLVAADVLDAPVPAGTLALARADDSVRPLKQLIHDHYLMGLEGVPGRYGPFSETDHRARRRYEYRLIERPVDRIRFCLEQMGHYIPPNEKDRAWISLPDGLGFLYYLLRPVRLLTLYGTGSSRHRAHHEPVEEGGINSDLSRV